MQNQKKMCKRILGTPTLREWREVHEKHRESTVKYTQGEPKNVKECYEVESFKEKNVINIVE